MAKLSKFAGFVSRVAEDPQSLGVFLSQPKEAAFRAGLSGEEQSLLLSGSFVDVCRHIQHLIVDRPDPDDQPDDP